MDNVFCAKFQFEVRYTHILDFNQIGRGIIAPFVKLSTGFNIGNEGTVEELIRLEFAHDKFAMEFRWDRAFVYTEGDLSRFNEETSSINIFFKILKKLKDHQSFGIFKNYVTLAFFVKVINEPYENIISTFQSDFLNSKVEKILNGVDDIALILEKGKKDEKNENIILGPYSSKKDNEMSQLIPFKSIEILKDPNTVGRMVKVQLFEITSDINFTKLKNVIGQVNNYKKYL